MTAAATPALSFVIPLYNSAETITAVVRDIEALAVEGGHEIILVNDGSRDATAEICRALVASTRVPASRRDVIVTSSTAGCCESRRRSSTPV